MKKKLFAILLAAAMVIGMAVPTMAAEGDVTITVNRDDTYVDTASGNTSAATGNREYTYYQVFRATYDTNTSTGGDSSVSNYVSVPGDITASGEGFSYYLDATSDASIIAKLGTWTEATETAPASWTKASGNKWFKLAKTADGKQFIVTWDNTSETATTVQEAAKWLVDNGVYVATGSLTAAEDGKSWSATVQKGYYVIKGSEGVNLVAATTDININEKNTYPTIDKKQADEDNTTMTDDKKTVAIGDVIDYQVTVKVPADANQSIVVTDTMTSGVVYDSTTSLTVKVGDTDLTATTDYEKGTESATGWVLTIKPTTATLGKDVVITFKATAVAAILADVDAESATTLSARRNTVELKYNGDHYVMTDYVEFTTYYTGIEKVDGKTTTKKLENVEFTLKEAGVEFKVSKPEGKDYYIPDANGSATVKTDKDGLIKIRGLDNEKTYTLTETKTNDGYNLLEGDVTLTLVEDKAADIAATAEFTQIKNNQGTVLPSTGGMGTTVLYIVGGVVVAAALVLLITKRRMRREDY